MISPKNVPCVAINLSRCTFDLFHYPLSGVYNGVLNRYCAYCSLSGVLSSSSDCVTTSTLSTFLPLKSWDSSNGKYITVRGVFLEHLHTAQHIPLSLCECGCVSSPTGNTNGPIHVSDCVIHTFNGLIRCFILYFIVSFQLPFKFDFVLDVFQFVSKPLEPLNEQSGANFRFVITQIFRWGLAMQLLKSPSPQLRVLPLARAITQPRTIPLVRGVFILLHKR